MGIGDTKAHLSEIVEHVQSTGKEIILTGHGKREAASS
jgi:prevent-host-death family protein